MTFEQAYRIDEECLADGNRILLPPSALHRLAGLIDIGYPLLFAIKSYITGHRVSHCGVLEFTADEGFVRMPKWMIKNLQVDEGQVVVLKSAMLPKGTYMKIQPHTTKFINLPGDPKEILERALKSFACVTAGDTIMITHEESHYYIDIVETMPSQAISLVETDCVVDFAPPLDYKEPEKPMKADQHILIPAKEEPKFKPFTGVARRLDGQGVTAVVPSPLFEEAVKAPEKQSVPRKCCGKVIFGAQDVGSQPGKIRTIDEEETNDKVSKAEEKKFQPFTGRRYTLGG